MNDLVMLQLKIRFWKSELETDPHNEANIKHLAMNRDKLIKMRGY